MTYSAAVVGAILVSIAYITWFPSAMESRYELTDSWGTKGDGQLEFSGPTGIVVGNDEVYVSDTGNNRIQVFTLDGKFLRTIGREGSGPNELSRPMHLYFSGEELYIADLGNDRIQIFSTLGNPIRRFGSSGSKEGQFDAPSGVAVENDGSIIVAGFYNQRVQRLDAKGAYLSQWGETRKMGVFSHKFNYPTDVAIGPNGEVIIADAYNDRIQVYSKTGDFLNKWGGPFASNLRGSANSWFNTATGVSTDKEGNVYVADFYNNRIQKFTLSGDFLTAIELDKDDNPMDRPTDMAASSDGRLFVADYGNNRILVFTQKQKSRNIE